MLRSQWVLLLLTSVLVMSELSSTDEIRQLERYQSFQNPNYRISTREAEKPRNTRAVPHQPLGFFGKLAFFGGLFFNQYNETTSALGRIRDILYDQFSDTATPSTVVETTTLEPNTTTTEKYRISRQEFGKLLNKNFRGIQKLMRIELADAKNQSQYNWRDYKLEFAGQIKPTVPAKNSTAKRATRQSNNRRN